ncbi:MAG: alpha/beta hydrolase [bacterium]|nr:alpha/beta hydrolase [bacterium]
MKTMTVNDLRVTYLDEGPRDGEAVILAHCSNASSREWASLMPLLVEEGYRVLAADFCGYGRSDPWPDNRPFNADADANILKALVDLAAGPVHFVGHSHGGAVTLEVARHLPAVLKSATLIEPVVFQLLHETGHPQWSVVTKMARRVQDAVDLGEHRSAAYIFTSFWIGRLKWFLLPQRHKLAITSTMKKVVLDFELVDLAHRTPEHYASITAPVQLIIGTRTRAPALAVGQLLLDVLPNVDLTSIKAGHMSPFTHQKQINDLVVAHLQTVSSAR